MNPYTKAVKPIALVLCAALLIFTSGCAVPTSNRAESRSGFYFDTVVQVTVYGGSAEVADGAMALCEKYDRLFSRTNENSEVYRLNHAGGQPFQVSEETMSLIKSGCEYAEFSGGVFDPTVAPLTELWTLSGDDELPGESEIAEALGKVGYSNIVIEGDIVTLKNGAEIDLGGIAKGYIADRIAEYLAESGASGGLVDLGGNIYCTGLKPDGKKFTIGVRDPENSSAYSAKLKLTDLSAVTSGGYERFYEKDGIKYIHILDPRTGYPVESDLLSATVISDRSTAADALSTTCFILGYDEAARLIESVEGCEAVFIKADGETVFTSGVGAGGIEIELN